MNNLLIEFINEECTSMIASMLISDIEQLIEEDAIEFKDYTFNRFNIYLNFSDKTAKIEDELDVDDSGSAVFHFDEFLRTLKAKLYLQNQSPQK